VRTRVKVCCMRDPSEVRIAAGAGADAIGLVGPMPSGPGVIDLETAARLARGTPPPVAPVLLTAETTAEAIATQVAMVGAPIVQVVQHIDAHAAAELAERLPHTRILQVVHVEDESALRLIERYSPFADAFLLDSGRPSAARPELGGTGRAHDWRISRAFVQASPLPVFLAGGLRPDNVRDAIETVRPHGVDLCSGVRRAGRLDAARLAAFMSGVRAADASLRSGATDPGAPPGAPAR
jgi:phosphoribosylanthranilate isomerase